MIQGCLFQYHKQLCLNVYTPNAYEAGYIHPPAYFRFINEPQELKKDDELCTGISSFVSNTQYLVLLDFTIPVHEENTVLLTKALNPRKGLLVNSGNSYHFYDYKAYQLEEWKVEMYKALHLPGIDFRYIGHSLLCGYGTLRITTHYNKPILPTIIKELI